jgi:hypothetical protein
VLRVRPARCIVRRFREYRSVEVVGSRHRYRRVCEESANLSRQARGLIRGNVRGDPRSAVRSVAELLLEKRSEAESFATLSRTPLHGCAWATVRPTSDN